MANSATLNLEPVLGASIPNDYADNVERERINTANISKLDQYASSLSASLFTMFCISGSTSDMLASDNYVGSEYNRVAKTLLEVVAWAQTSGSGGVTRVDVQLQEPGSLTWNSIFSDAALKPAVSSSLGDFGTSRATVFTTSSWAPGCMMRCKLDTAAGAPGISGQKGLTVQIFYKLSTPS